MSILVDKHTRLLIQGITGSEGQFHGAQMIDMIEAIREDREPAVNGREARRAIHALDLIYRAAGRPA